VRRSFPTQSSDASWEFERDRYVTIAAINEVMQRIEPTQARSDFPSQSTALNGHRSTFLNLKFTQDLNY
jgi:hypothetical protein